MRSIRFKKRWPIKSIYIFMYKSFIHVLHLFWSIKLKG